MFAFAENPSKSKLKSVDTLLKDKKYRGKSAKRKDLFEGPRILDDSFDRGIISSENEDNEVVASESDEGGADISDQDSGIISDDDKSDGSSVSSDNLDSESEEEDLQDGDHQDRHDQIRQLLAQETRYLFKCILDNSDPRTVAEQLSESAQADAEKGRDIKTQQVISSKYLNSPRIAIP